MSDTVRATSRQWWLPVVLVAVLLIAVIAWTRPSQSSTWNATAMVGTETFEINRARIPRTAAALVRGSGTEFGDRVHILPIEETGLVSVTASGDTPESAAATLESLLPVVIHDLNRVGADVGSFVQLTESTTRRAPVPLGRTNTLLFGLVGLTSLSLSVARFQALHIAVAPAVTD